MNFLRKIDHYMALVTPAMCDDPDLVTGQRILANAPERLRTLDKVNLETAIRRRLHDLKGTPRT